ncbi:recombinase family protein [Dyella sp. GSA-30]|uniref:recombinase family protein n=1 Tax=Dyella sp. GSA-30 TaxID=2994496 RepID=UPI00248FDD9D|nr:recombinase family protein [Dyella sp. GSA-30]
MSTDKQDTSVANQQTAIAAYASAHHMVVAQSYVDEGLSGLDLEGRPALQRLLDHAQMHCTGCTAILVLDVSRWGRFQNVDESAFYEFLCTQHGLRVIYVAEPFTGGEGPLHAVLKSLKRSMAAEYSRELSAKVFAGQARLVCAGFTMGGPAAYGLSRMLVDASGKPRCILKPGERKSIATDRVRLVLGSRDEVAVVRWMFKQSAAGVSMNDIAKQLNQKGKRPARGGASWSASTIRGMLDDERYLRGERPLDYLILPAVSAKTWPDVIQNSPDAGARFYLFDSLRVLRELAALSMGVPDHACDRLRDAGYANSR